MASEREAVTVGHGLGNAAAMREALLKAIVLLKVCEWPDDTSMQGVAEVMEEIEKALAAPPRQCDVGTAEEQAERYEEFCFKYFVAQCRSEKPCIGCPCEGQKDSCHFAWAQMPYEEGGAK